MKNPGYECPECGDTKPTKQGVALHAVNSEDHEATSTKEVKEQIEDKPRDSGTTETPNKGVQEPSTEPQGNGSGSTGLGLSGGQPFQKTAEKSEASEEPSTEPSESEESPASGTTDADSNSALAILLVAAAALAGLSLGSKRAPNNDPEPQYDVL